MLGVVCHRPERRAGRHATALAGGLQKNAQTKGREDTMPTGIHLRNTSKANNPTVFPFSEIVSLSNLFSAPGCN